MGDGVDEREFWIQFRRWLKGRIAGDQLMVAAIERRFRISDNEATKERQRPTPALTH
jgi:hypothetical protein